MEFYNEKLLPKGLPELLCQVIPEEFYLNTKVIAYPRKQRQGVAGSVTYDRLSHCWKIKLYPTIIAFFYRSSGVLGIRGTYSFDLWTSFLHTSLHEIGHMASWEAVENVPAYIDEHGSTVFSSMERHLYTEKLADDWANHTAERILQANPRLVQPEGALGGYPGKLAYNRRGGGHPWGSEIDYGRINIDRIIDWRGLGCGGQINIKDIVNKLYDDLSLGPVFIENEEKTPNIRAKVEVRLRREIHQAAKALGVNRFFTNKNGRRYLMFNVTEADAIYQYLVPHKWRYVPQIKKPLRWEFVDGFWELIEVEEAEKIPIEQLTLPSFAHRKRRIAKEAQQ